MATVLSKDFKLKLFLSVDLIGSTAFKAKSSNKAETAAPDGPEPEDWSAFMLYFFSEFPMAFARGIEFFRGPQAWKGQLPAYRLWKNLGDELIYTADITSLPQLKLLLCGFHRAVNDCEDNVKGRAGLQLKGTAWVANFPLANREITFEEDEDENERGEGKKKAIEKLTDYFGPDIDIGFRISKAARDKVLVISMPLAELLAPMLDARDFGISNVGWEILKGVFDGKPYPIFWFYTECAPEYPPWENFLDERTGRFSTSGSLTAANLVKTIDQVRKKVGPGYLFPAKFSEAELDPAEKRRLERLRSKKEKPPDEFVPF